LPIGTPTSIGGIADTGPTGTSFTANTTAAVPAAADTLIIMACSWVTSSNAIATGSLAGMGLTWTKHGEITGLGGGVGWGHAVFSADGSAGEATGQTMTLTTSISCFGAGFGMIYNTGLNTDATGANRVDITDGQMQTGSTFATFDTTATTTTVADTFLYGGALIDGVTTVTATGGGTQAHHWQDGTNGWTRQTQYKILASAQSTSLTGSIIAPQPGHYVAGFSAFKAAASTPPDIKEGYAVPAGMLSPSLIEKGWWH
jgi:hypothetical protein